jgi:hypothetical protein
MQTSLKVNLVHWLLIKYKNKKNMTLPEPIFPHLENDLSKLLYSGNFEDCIAFMQAHNIPANAVLTDRSNTSLIEEVMSGVPKNNSLGQNNHFPLVKYLLENGADSSVMNKDRYNALYLAATKTEKMPYLELMLQYPMNDIDAKDGYGNTVFFAFLRDMYGKWAWKSIALKHKYLAIAEKFLQLGADAESLGRQGCSIRSWVTMVDIAERDALLKLFDRYKDTPKASPKITPKAAKTNLTYPEIGKEIWKKLVPARGACDTVQGELLRAIEKLSDEAQRNGNINFNTRHKNMAKFIKTTLLAAPIFDAGQKEEINAYISLISKKTQPYTDDDAYDYLTDRICEFYMKNPELIPFISDED